MTRRIEADGDSLEQALVQALADLAGCDPEDVELRLDAPGLDVSAAAHVTIVPSSADALATGRDDETDEEADGEPDDDADDDSSDADQAEERDQDHRPSTRDRLRDDDEEELDLDAEADAAADFLEGLLDVLELPGDLKIRITDEHAEVEIVEVGSGALIGRRGQTLEAIQELARCALQREFQRRSHVKIDIEGYRERRLEKLLEKAEEAIETVLETGETERLEPMDVFERKAVHHLVAEYDGVSSRSQGREPARRVMIEPV